MISYLLDVLHPSFSRSTSIPKTKISSLHQITLAYGLEVENMSQSNNGTGGDEGLISLPFNPPIQEVVSFNHLPSKKRTFSSFQDQSQPQENHKRQKVSANRRPFSSVVYSHLSSGSFIFQGKSYHNCGVS